MAHMELLAASRAGDVAKLRVLLAAGDEDGFTAFLHACDKGQAAFAEALLAAGCDAAAVTNDGRTGLILAAAAGHATLLPQRISIDPPAR